MRNAFATEVTELAGADARVVLLSGDIGNRLFDPFKAQFPERFYNCGVAEANMVGVAAGLALSGMRPIAYTICPFLTARCLEQIRVDLCYHDLPVVLVGVGAGLSYASLGPTHHSCEDIAWLRSLPNMTVVCPADPIEVRLGLRAAVQQGGPVYLRLGKKGEPMIHAQPPAFTLGKAITVCDGSDVCLLSTGTVLGLALQVAEELQRQLITVRVASVPTVKPLDTDYLADAFQRFPLVVTVEEHSRIGGFGSAVAEWLADERRPTAPLLRFGTDDRFLHQSGDQEYARAQLGLDAGRMARQIRRRLLQARSKTVNGPRRSLSAGGCA